MASLCRRRRDGRPASLHRSLSTLMTRALSRCGWPWQRRLDFAILRRWPVCSTSSCAACWSRRAPRPWRRRRRDCHGPSSTDRPALLSAIGRRLFFDPALSASGKLSCASCHDPAHAYGPPDARAVEPGGKDMRHMGLRAVPSLRYMQATPQFTEHYYDSDDESRRQRRQRADRRADLGRSGGSRARPGAAAAALAFRDGQ